eukprot:754678-Pelagomonas_calceolata.AAC.1
MWTPLLDLGPGGARSGDFAIHLQTFQFADKPTDLHNSNRNEIITVCSNNGGDVHHKLRGENTEVCTKFVDAMWSRTCTPCPGVWMKEPLMYGLLLIVQGEQVAMNGRSSLHGAHSALHTCMREPGMVCCREVLLVPQALHFNATFVSGRTGFINHSASLATLPSLLSSTIPAAHTHAHLEMTHAHRPPSYPICTKRGQPTGLELRDPST